jgi:hypothetical protein
MDTFYTNTKKSWYPDEDAKLIRLHRHTDLVELANIHKRTPGRIIRRLKFLKCIKASNEVIGYTDYLNSELFYTINNREPEEKTEEETEEVPYSKSNSIWTQDDCTQLTTEYKVNNLTLIDLATLIKRHPDCVVHKLKELKIIKTLKSCKGYNTYKNSDLYKDYQKNRRNLLVYSACNNFAFNESHS